MLFQNTSHYSRSGAVLHSKGTGTSKSLLILYFHRLLRLASCFFPSRLSVTFLPPHLHRHKCLLVCSNDWSGARQSPTAASNEPDDGEGDDDDDDDGSQCGVLLVC